MEKTDKVKDNLFKIKKNLDIIIDMLKEKGFNFDYHVVTNLNKVTDFNTKQVYKCPNKTIILKDIASVEEGVGVIYNITAENVLIIGTLGVGFLNTQHGIGMTNSYYFFPLDEIEPHEVVYKKFLKVLVAQYMLKYEIKEIPNLEDIFEKIKTFD